jgi:hypothetical protein
MKEYINTLSPRSLSYGRRHRFPLTGDTFWRTIPFLPRSFKLTRILTLSTFTCPSSKHILFVVRVGIYLQLPYVLSQRCVARCSFMSFPTQSIALVFTQTFGGNDNAVDSGYQPLIDSLEGNRLKMKFIFNVLPPPPSISCGETVSEESRLNSTAIPTLPPDEPLGAGALSAQVDPLQRG